MVDLLHLSMVRYAMYSLSEGGMYTLGLMSFRRDCETWRSCRTSAQSEMSVSTQTDHHLILHASEPPSDEIGSKP